MYDMKWFKKMISCPVSSISSTFTKDGALDWNGFSNQIEQSIAAGSHAILLTWGDSLYSILKDEEILDINQFVIRQVNRRAMTIASGNCWPTGAAVEFAEKAKQWGADLVISLCPNWAGSGNADTFYQHYKSIGQVMPAMAMTSIVHGGGPLPLQTIERLLEDPKSGLAAVKDDVCGTYGRRLGIKINGRCAFLSGGTKMNYMDQVLYGADGYLSAFIKFKPEISREFWGLMQKGETDSCMEIIKKKEMPFMLDLPEKLGLEFDSVILAAMEIQGICKRWRRNPYQNATEEQMVEIRDFISRM